MPEEVKETKTKAELKTSDYTQVKFVENGRYVFKSTNDYVQVLEPVRMKIGIDQQGNAEKVIYNTDKALRVTFKYCTMEATPEMAETLGVEHQYLVNQLLHNKACGKIYHLISAPGFEPSASLIAWVADIEKRAENRLPAVASGVKVR